MIKYICVLGLIYNACYGAAAALPPKATTGQKRVRSEIIKDLEREKQQKLERAQNLRHAIINLDIDAVERISQEMPLDDLRSFILKAFKDKAFFKELNETSYETFLSLRLDPRWETSDSRLKDTMKKKAQEIERAKQERAQERRAMLQKEDPFWLTLEGQILIDDGGYTTPKKRAEFILQYNATQKQMRDAVKGLEDNYLDPEKALDDLLDIVLQK